MELIFINGITLLLMLSGSRAASPVPVLGQHFLDEQAEVEAACLVHSGLVPQPVSKDCMSENRTDKEKRQEAIQT